jgi:hypothetical protein
MKFKKVREQIGHLTWYMTTPCFPTVVCCPSVPWTSGNAQAGHAYKPSEV